MNVVQDCRYGKMMFNPNDIYIGRSLSLYGEFSEKEAEIFRHFVHPGNIVVEGGANIGCHTVVFANLVGSEGKVVAFEPEKCVYYTLCGNLALNSMYHNTCIYNAALGARQDHVKVPMLNYDESFSIGVMSLVEQPTEDGGLFYDVPLYKVDSLDLPRCDFIKADVEGMEKEVIEGASDTIARFRPTLYVENDREETAKALKEHIYALGYKVYYHFPRLYNEQNHKNIKENIFGNICSLNLLCIPKEKNLPFKKPSEYRLTLWKPGDCIQLNYGKLNI